MAEHDEEVVPLLTIDEEDEETLVQGDFLDVLPILAVKNTVLFPGIIVPITAGRDRSVKAINKARATRIAIDIPTGIDGRSGQVRGVAVDRGV